MNMYVTSDFFTILIFWQNCCQQKIVQMRISIVNLDALSEKVTALALRTANNSVVAQPFPPSPAYTPTLHYQHRPVYELYNFDSGSKRKK